MMKLKVTDVEFDWGNDDWGIVHPDDIELGEQYKNKIINSVLNQVYEVESEMELSDVVSDETGWCIMSVTYEEVYHVPNESNDTGVPLIPLAQ